MNTTHSDSIIQWSLFVSTTECMYNHRCKIYSMFLVYYIMSSEEEGMEKDGMR